MSELLKAFEFAERFHRTQFKKETTNPFIYHPMAVASLVLQYGGDNKQAAAALLHDTIGDISEDELKKICDSEVADLAYAFSDPPLPANPSWKQMKDAYLEKIAQLNERKVLIIACEELHDLREIVHDQKYYPDKIWKRYSVQPRDVRWYYESLNKIFKSKRLSNALLKEFDIALAGFQIV